MAQIEFNNQLVPQNLIDIDDVGQCAIECSNDEGFFYYMLIKTSLGTTTITTCGPIVPDVELIPNGFQIYLKRYEYKEEKIVKDVNLYLNDKTRKITDAKVIDYNDAIEHIRDIKIYLKAGGE